MRSIAPRSEMPVPVAIAVGDGAGPEIVEAALSVIVAAGVSIEPSRLVIGRQDPGPLSESDRRLIEDAGVLFKGPVDGGVAVGFSTELGLTGLARQTVVRRVESGASRADADVLVIRGPLERRSVGVDTSETGFVEDAFGLAARMGRKRIVRIMGSGRDVGGEAAAFVRAGSMFPAIETAQVSLETAILSLTRDPASAETFLAGGAEGRALCAAVAGLSGCPSLTASIRFGARVAVFEPSHGTVKRLAGRFTANPIAMIVAAAALLRYVGETGKSDRILRALDRTLDDGVHTADIAEAGITRRCVSTRVFANAVAARLGQTVAAAGTATTPPPPRPALATMNGNTLNLEG